MCFIASWFPVQLLLLNTILNTPWGYREDSQFPWALMTNTIRGMRINSSENLELLKQSYIWIISSQLIFFPLQSYVVMEKTILTLDPYPNRPMPFPVPSCHTEPRSAAGPVLHGQSSEGKGPQGCLQHGAHSNTLKFNRNEKGSGLCTCKSYCKVQDMFQLEGKHL